MRKFIKWAGIVYSQSGLCLDSVGALQRYLVLDADPRRHGLITRFHIRFTPLILERIRNSSLSLEEKGRLFSGVMALFRSGPTFKTTAARRSPLSDAVISRLLGPGVRFADVGSSDGSSILSLLENSRGADMLLTDRQSHFSVRFFWPFHLFYNHGEYLTIKLPLFYLCTGIPSGAVPKDASKISPLNPIVPAELSSVIASFDAFKDNLPNQADIIRCANLLNLVYFPAPELAVGIGNLVRNLKPDGILFVVHNNEKYAGGESYFSLRKKDGCLLLDPGTGDHELLPFLRDGKFPSLPGIVVQSGPQ